MSLIFRNVFLSLGAVFTAMAHAQTPLEPPAEPANSEWQWGGSWTVVGQRLSGADMVDSSKRRQLNTRLDLELQREFSQLPGRFYGQLRTGSGSGLQINTPVFTSAVNTTAFAGSDNHLHDIKSVLAQAWLQFDLDSVVKGLSVVAGKIDPTVFFDHSDLAHDESMKFMNNIFVHNPLLDSGGNYGIDENGFSPGALVQYQTQHEDQANWIWSLGAFGAGNGTNLDQSPSNPFLIVQLRRFGELFPGLQGSAAIYYWTNPKAENVLTAQPEKQAGWGFSGDQQIRQDLAVFVRLSYGGRGVRSFDRALTYGVEQKGNLWGLPEDHIGLAIGRLQPDSVSVLNGAPAFTERSMELLYSHAMSGNWWLSADFQRIQSPGGDSTLPSIRVWGVRSTVKF
ncbi:carbohydrate-selective porin (OprB family) [Limnobacter thiooxidans]|nr:carbohydrate-selective porin (OprB family) [Limnobacter thiooxidans]